MTAQATAARRAYKREWAKKHPEKIREYQQKYWTKKAEQAAAPPLHEQKGETEQE